MKANGEKWIQLDQSGPSKLTKSGQSTNVGDKSFYNLVG